jgi:hypothetical protein
MVFLFPGVLFRKFYFSGQFGNQFEQGNLLERFLWTLFLSLVCLSSVSFIFYILDITFSLKPLEGIDFKKISSIFESLSNNEFPNSFTNETEFVNFLTLIFVIYFISVVLGFLSHNIIRTLSLDRYSIFKFKNNWHYLSQAYKENGINRKIGDVYTTFVDVLVKNNSKEELYRGILNNFILDKDNKLENIVLSNVYKFISIEKSEENKINEIEKSIENEDNIYSLHRDYLNKKVFKKSIDGNLLVLSNENILNINFTYIKTSNKVNYWKGNLYNFIKIIYFIIILGLIVLPFLQIDIRYFYSITSKIIFSITSLLIMSIFLNYITQLLKIKKTDDKTELKDIFFITLFFLTPYLWIFEITKFVATVLIALSVLLVYGIFMSKNKNE